MNRTEANDIQAMTNFQISLLRLACTSAGNQIEELRELGQGFTARSDVGEVFEHECVRT